MKRVLLVAGVLLLPRGGAAQAPRAQAPQTAVFAGGCFWGVEAVFEHTRGVISAVSGYAGGSVQSPSYQQVSDGNTGHAESVRVTYDPAQVSYQQLLEIFFLVAHDPTQLNRQGPDVGTQYRSALFYRDEEQRRAAQEMAARIAAMKAWPGKIVTAIEPLTGFYQAESYHQHYLTKHPDQPYIIFNDLPKLERLKQLYPLLYQAAPPDLQRLRDTVGVILDAGVRDSAFPGAIAVIGTRDRVLVDRAAGHLDWAPSPAPTDSTLWDLASLTKVTALTTAIMQLWERGLIDLDAPVERYLPRFTGPLKERVTVRHLLTHSSGLPAWRPLYLEAPTPDSVLTLVYATPLDTMPGTRMVYSDLGAILLGQIVVRLTSEPFDQYVGERIFQPLRMNDTRFRPPREMWDRVAPTEVDTAWRKRQLRGEVHDENTFALGGISSHAGLFSSARDMARFARMLLRGGELDGVRMVALETIAWFTALQDSALSNRALGWEKPNGRNSAGHRLSARAFGHTGFTGTSIWIDPGNDVFIVLLTNRVNPTRARAGIFRVRADLADAVIAVLQR